MKKRTHKSALEAVRQLVTALGGKAYVFNQVGRLRGSAGIPDMFCVARGKSFWVEIKVGEDQLSPAQLDFQGIVDPHVPVLTGGLDEVCEHLGLATEGREPTEDGNGGCGVDGHTGQATR